MPLRTNLTGSSAQRVLVLVVLTLLKPQITKPQANSFFYHYYYQDYYYRCHSLQSGRNPIASQHTCAAPSAFDLWIGWIDTSLFLPTLVGLSHIIASHLVQHCINSDKAVSSLYSNSFLPINSYFYRQPPPKYFDLEKGAQAVMWGCV